MKRRGFSIIELLIYMGIISVFLVILAGILVAVLDSQLKSEAATSVDQSSQYLISRLQYDIRRATGITTPVNLGDTASSLVLTIGGSSYTYAVSAGVLTLATGVKTYNLSPFDVVFSGFSVTRLGNISGKNSVQIGFTVTSLAKDTTGQNAVRSYLTTVDVR